MTRGERRALLAGAVVLAVVCCLLFARAVLTARAADVARTQVRAALLPAKTPPSTDAAERMMLGWSGATEQMRYWQALQRFRLVTAQANSATQYTLSASLPLVFRLEETETYLRKAATEDGSRPRRSRLEDMLGLAYYDDAELHAGEDPVEPELDGRAIAAFRQAVLLDESNAPAKTNLELVLRKQLKHHTAKTQPAKAVPDSGRIQALIQSANGLPSQNGAVGKRVHGGY